MKSTRDNDQLTMALAAFARSDFGQIIIQWFEESKEEQRDLNDNLNGNELYRGTGASKTLKEILDEIKGANPTVSDTQLGGEGAGIQ